MNIKCPHCGTEYDAEDDEYGRFVKCAICDKGFVVGVVTAQPDARKGALTNVAIDESRSSDLQHSRSQLSAKRRSPWVRTEGAGAVARQMRAYAQEKDNGDRVPTAIIVVGLLIVVGIVASIVLPKLNSVATRVAWQSGQSDAIQLEEFDVPTRYEINKAKEAMSKQHQSAADLSAVGRGMAPLLLKNLGKAFDCPLCGGHCKIPSSLKYKIGEERDCLCPHCHKRFKHILR